jgi:hypothetical protein
LERQPAVLLEHLVMDVLDGLEPRHSRIVDVVRLVVEDRELVHLAHDLTEIRLAVVDPADRLWAKRIEEIVPQVIVFERRVGHVTEEHAMDVRQENVARLTNRSYVVLDVQRDLKVVAPVAAVVPVGWQYRIVEKDPQAVEVRPQSIENDDVGRDDEEVAREARVRLVEPMKEAPRNQERQDLCLARAGGHLQHIAWPLLVEHARRHSPGSVEAQQVELVPRAAHVVEPNESLDSFSLREVVPELRERPVCVFEEMLGFKPPTQETDRCRGGPNVPVLTPRVYLVANLCDKRRKELFVRCRAERLVRGEPSL